MEKIDRNYQVIIDRSTKAGCKTTEMCFNQAAPAYYTDSKTGIQVPGDTQGCQAKVFYQKNVTLLLYAWIYEFLGIAYFGYSNPAFCYCLFCM